MPATSKRRRRTSSRPPSTEGRALIATWSNQDCCVAPIAAAQSSGGSSSKADIPFADYRPAIAGKRKWAQNMLNRIRYIAGHAFELGDVAVRPYPSGDDRRVGRGSRPTRASCCAQYAIVEYWRCDALG